jgi:hypothetical protein
VQLLSQLLLWCASCGGQQLLQQLQKVMLESVTWMLLWLMRCGRIAARKVCIWVITCERNAAVNVCSSFV